MCAGMTESSTDKTTTETDFSSEMEFTDEELMWLLSLSAEVPDGKLTPTEECWGMIAKPRTRCDARLFQLLASKRFGISDFVLSKDMIQP